MVVLHAFLGGLLQHVNNGGTWKAFLKILVPHLSIMWSVKEWSCNMEMGDCWKVWSVIGFFLKGGGLNQLERVGIFKIVFIEKEGCVVDKKRLLSFSAAYFSGLSIAPLCSAV